MAYAEEDFGDDEFFKVIEVGPLKLEKVESNSEIPTFTKRTVDTLENVFDNSPKSILAVHDQSGENS
jgi:hypothetical protein